MLFIDHLWSVSVLENDQKCISKIFFFFFPHIPKTIPLVPILTLLLHQSRSSSSIFIPVYLHKLTVLELLKHFTFHLIFFIKRAEDQMLFMVSFLQQTEMVRERMLAGPFSRSELCNPSRGHQSELEIHKLAGRSEEAPSLKDIGLTRTP